MAIRKPHHIGAFTPNLAKTEAFLHSDTRSAGGGPHTRRRNKHRLHRSWGHLLGMIESKDRTQPAPPNHSGLAHIALEVDDVDAVYQDLVSKGVQFHVHPMDAGHGIRLAFFRDPDGLEIELFKQD